MASKTPLLPAPASINPFLHQLSPNSSSAHAAFWPVTFSPRNRPSCSIFSIHLTTTHSIIYIYNNTRTHSERLLLLRPCVNRLRDTRAPLVSFVYARVEAVYVAEEADFCDYLDVWVGRSSRRNSTPTWLDGPGEPLLRHVLVNTGKVVWWLRRDNESFRLQLPKFGQDFWACVGWGGTDGDGKDKSRNIS